MTTDTARTLETVSDASSPANTVSGAHHTAPTDATTHKKRILICDTQPVAVEGMKWLIENSEDMQVAASVAALHDVRELLNSGTARVVEGLAALDFSSARSHDSQQIPATRATMPSSGHSRDYDAIVIDKGFGIADVMEFLQKQAASSQLTPVVVWGNVTESEALRLLQAGAKGILRRTSESGTLLTCLREVTAGGTWMEDGIFGTVEKLFNPRRSHLTQRENEVVALVEKGLRNRDIAKILGIQTGTVKIHLKHIFEKTGVRGRYGLAFTGLQNKGSIVTAPRQYTA